MAKLDDLLAQRDALDIQLRQLPVFGSEPIRDEATALDEQIAQLRQAVPEPAPPIPVEPAPLPEPTPEPTPTPEPIPEPSAE